MNQVSIIIPVHNTPEEYLRECLHSVLRQDYTNWEAILIDDGSTSGAERICDEYAAKDARFCVIHQRQSGVSAARNAGMAAANGDWLIFLDSDDWWEDNLLSSAMKKLAEEPADLLVFSYWNTFNAAENVLSSVHGTAILRHTKHDHNGEELQLGMLDRNDRYIAAYYMAHRGCS
ncbi:MAG: glycosyltransferase family 2 protein [Christensenellales bacterium]